MVGKSAGDKAGAGAVADGEPLPIIHESVFDRIKAGVDGYSPIVLPERFRLTNRAGAILGDIFEHPSQAQKRTCEQEPVWDLVWWRRVLYFATVLVSLFLIAMPLIEKFWPGRGAASPLEFLIPLIAAVGVFLPNLAKPWLQAFEHAPERFGPAALLVAILLFVSGMWQGRIWDRMRSVWGPIFKAGPTDVGPTELAGGFLHALRTSSLYRAFFFALTHRILPLVFAVIIFAVSLYAAFVVVNRIVFAAASAAGWVCIRSVPNAVDINGATTPIAFQTRELCKATGVAVKKGGTYRVTLKITDGWEDGYKLKEPDANKAKGIETDPNGFGQDKMTWMMEGGIPLRRLLWSNWFATVVRVGDRGLEEHPLAFTLAAEGGPAREPVGRIYSARFTAWSDGELFLFVNDAVLGIPRLVDFFYRGNNKGSALVSFERVP